MLGAPVASEGLSTGDCIAGARATDRRSKPLRKTTRYSRIVIGYTTRSNGSFNGTPVFIGAGAFVAILSHWVIVGEIKRLELRPRAA